MKTARRREGEGREREFCVEIKEPRLRESFFPHFFPPFFFQGPTRTEINKKLVLRRREERERVQKSKRDTWFFF